MFHLLPPWTRDVGAAGTRRAAGAVSRMLLLLLRREKPRRGRIDRCGKRSPQGNFVRRPKHGERHLRGSPDPPSQSRKRLEATRPAARGRGGLEAEHPVNPRNCCGSTMTTRWHPARTSPLLPLRGLRSTTTPTNSRRARHAGTAARGSEHSAPWMQTNAYVFVSEKPRLSAPLLYYRPTLP